MSDRVVSVIIPVYNAKQYLAECLESILRQTYSAIEIIAVNDGSTDGSEEILRFYSQKDHRIRVINQPNSGQSVARNVGMKAATGAYIAFVDSDDYIEPDMLERMLERMHMSEADVVESGYDEVYDDGGFRRYVPYPKKYDEVNGTCNIMEKHVEGVISLLVWNKLYKADQVRAIAFADGKKYEDILWSAETLLNTQKICSVKDCLYHWRQHSGSTTHAIPTMSRLSAVDHFAQRINMLSEHPKVALLAKGRIVCECYLECKTMLMAGDIMLINAAKKHSLECMKQNMLSFQEVIRLGSLTRVIRYHYYLVKFLCIQISILCFCFGQKHNMSF